MQNTIPSEMPYRSLGSTGERVSAIGLGGWHIGFKHIAEDMSIRIIRSAIDSGIKTEPKSLSDVQNIKLHVQCPHCARVHRFEVKTGQLIQAA